MDFKGMTDLRFLLAIDKYRNLTRAAKELHISQPGLTKFLKRTEKALGVELFRWTGNAMIPTPAGKEYIAFAKTVLSMNDDLNSRIAALPNEKPYLRIGFCVNSVSAFSDAITDFQELYPNVELSITEGFSNSIKDLFLGNKLDLIFVTNAVYSPDLIIEPLCCFDFRIYVPANLYIPPIKTVSFSNTPWIDLRNLCNAKFVSMRATNEPTCSDNKIFKKYGFEPASQIFVTSLQSKIQLTQSLPAACFLVVDSNGRSASADFTDYEHLYSFGSHSHGFNLSAVYSKNMIDPFYVNEFLSLVKQEK